MNARGTEDGRTYLNVPTSNETYRDKVQSYSTHSRATRHLRWSEPTTGNFPCPRSSHKTTWVRIAPRDCRGGPRATASLVTHHQSESGFCLPLRQVGQTSTKLTEGIGAQTWRVVQKIVSKSLVVTVGYYSRRLPRLRQHHIFKVHTQ
jgi:hypothetical protein